MIGQVYKDCAVSWVRKGGHPDRLKHVDIEHVAKNTIRFTRRNGTAVSKKLEGGYLEITRNSDGADLVHDLLVESGQRELAEQRIAHREARARMKEEERAERLTWFYHDWTENDQLVIGRGDGEVFWIHRDKFDEVEDEHLRKFLGTPENWDWRDWDLDFRTGKYSPPP